MIAPNILINADFAFSTKMQSIIRKHGTNIWIVYHASLMLLHARDGEPLNFDDLDILCLYTGIDTDELQRCIKILIDIELLQIHESGIVNTEVINNISKLLNKREIYKNNALKGVEKRSKKSKKIKNLVANDEQLLSNSEANLTKHLILNTKDLDNNKNSQPIIFEPEFKSESQDVEASYTQNGNSVECSFKIKPKQELERPTQPPSLALDSLTPSIVDDLGEEFVPELVLQNKEKFNALQEIKKGVISTNVHGDKIIQLRNGKTNSKSYRNLFFTDKEREKLLEYYEKNGLKEYLTYGLVKLNDYPLTNLKNFTKYKSHYSVMIGWIAKACQEQKILDEREAKFKK